eukprot:501389_1
MDQTTNTYISIESIYQYDTEDIRKLSNEMVQLFSIYVSHAWSGDEMIYKFGNEYQGKQILDLIKEIDGKSMSMFLTNFIRLLRKGITTQEAKQGKWIDILDDKITNKSLFHQEKKYHTLCHALYKGINQYINNIVSKYKHKYSNIEQQHYPIWLDKHFNVDINSSMFKNVLNTQIQMGNKCRKLHLRHNRSDYSMHEYILTALKFMAISVFMVVFSSINMEFKQQKQNAIQYQPDIKDVLFSTHTSLFSHSNNNMWQNITYFISPFNQKLDLQLNDTYERPLELEYFYDTKSQWISNEPFDYTPQQICSVKKPFDTNETLIPAFRTLLDYSTSQNVQLMTNLTANNHFYDLYMNTQSINLVNNVITNDINNSLFITNYFNTPFEPKDINLSKGAKRLLNEENAGGTSELSEAFSFEVLKHSFEAKLLKTEMEIKYQWCNCPITDYLAEINGVKIGVSVTRAFKYKGQFNEYDALKLLNKKIRGCNESTYYVQECDEWQRQILHIWTTDTNVEINTKEKDILFDVYKRLLISNATFLENTIVFVTVASPEMWWLFRQHKYMNRKLSNKKCKKKHKKKKKKSFV